MMANGLAPLLAVASPNAFAPLAFTPKLTTARALWLSQAPSSSSTSSPVHRAPRSAGVGGAASGGSPLGLVEPVEERVVAELEEGLVGRCVSGAHVTPSLCAGCDIPVGPVGAGRRRVRRARATRRRPPRCWRS